MKKLIGAMLACLMAGSLMAATPEITNSTGGIKSERGSTDLVTDADAAPMKNYRKDGDLYDRQYMHQPPPTPHDTRNYEVDNTVTKCPACHSVQNASKM